MVCSPLDVACQFTESITNMLMPLVVIVLVVLAAVFILPRFGKRGALLGLLILILIAAWYGLIPFVPALGGFF